MGGLLHLVQREGGWAGPQPAQSPSRCTKCNSPPINGQCTNFILYLISTVLPSWWWIKMYIIILFDVALYLPLHCKARYTLATKLNSTRSTLLKVDKINRVALAPYSTHWRQSRPYRQQSWTYQQQCWNFMNTNEHRRVKVEIADPTWANASSAFPWSSYCYNCWNWCKNHISVCHFIEMTSLVAGSSRDS